MRHSHLPASLLLGSLLFAGSAFASDGRVEHIIVHSPAIEGNLLGDRADRPVAVILPPDYDEQLQQRYPVIYFLPWHGSDNRGAMGYFTYRSRFVNDIAEGRIPPMIVVAAEGQNRYGACYYNSPVTGNWEDYIAEDLVQHIDANYRTLPQAASRGIGGKSAGAQGAMSIALRRPDVFGAVYSMKGYMAYSSQFLTDAMWREQIEAGDEPKVLYALAFAAPFAPNLDKPPLFVDMPYELVDGELQRVDAVFDRLVSGFPLAQVDDYVASGTRLRGIFFENAVNDMRGLGWTNQQFSEALTEAGIEHTYRVIPGSHDDNRDTAIDALLPFFVDNLAFQPLPTAVETESWAVVKAGRPEQK